MKHVAALTPIQARNSPINRLGPALDNVRGAIARMGLRPYRVFLVWTFTTGDARGEGIEKEYHRLELLPQPRLDGLTQARNATSAGINIDGVVGLSGVSVVSYDFDTLIGKTLPAPFNVTKKEPRIPSAYDFYYEIFEDGRVAPPLTCRTRGTVEPYYPGRTKWRISTQPERRPLQWVFSLERINEDATRAGTSNLNDHDVELPED